jgi:hypothetical protein
MNRPAVASMRRNSSIWKRNTGTISGSNCEPTQRSSSPHAISWDVIAHQPLRVARAVPRLVVTVAAGHDVAHERERLEALALGGVGPEHRQLLGRQLAGLVQLVVRQGP